MSSTERQVIIVSEKTEKLARIKRSLEILFNDRGETVKWFEANNDEDAIAAIDQALTTIEDTQETLQILIATSGLNGRWFEAPGYAKLKEVELKGKIAVQAVLMGGTVVDAHEAKVEGIESVTMTDHEFKIAANLAQVLFGEMISGQVAMTQKKSQLPKEKSSEPRYETFEEAP